MSTSYPHYYLFLLPSLSIIFSTYLTSFSFKSSFSSLAVCTLLFLTILILSSVLLFSIINYKDLLIQYIYINPLIIYFLTSYLILSYFFSIRFLFDVNKLRLNLIRFFYNIIIPQYISISLLFNFGVLGNPNYNTKLFLKDEAVSSIINYNTIYLYGVDSKIQTLLSYYLPFSKVLDDFDEISNYKYVITSNNNPFDKSDLNHVFKSIKKFDNHILLMNIRK